MKVKCIMISMIFFITVTIYPLYTPVHAAEMEELSSASAVLMEPLSGQILYSKNMEETRSPASITKIMTLLLIFEKIEAGDLTMDEEVTTSAHAKSMGGSQIFLEEDEKQDVETMIKAIVIASGNDASVAMAEHMEGSEEAFVEKMNHKASELGMSNTHFVDCCGLTDSKDHYTTAQDVAVMSRELITRFPKILEYSGIWQEEIIHTTHQGSKPFTLTNTNKLIRGYEGCMGLKTGSTSLAKYCVSAVASRNNMTLISVILGAPDPKTRFREAADLLNLGFSKCRLVIDEDPPKLKPVKVTNAYGEMLDCYYEDQFAYVDTSDQKESQLERKLEIPKEMEAPIKKDSQIGYIQYYLNGKEIGKEIIRSKETIKPSNYKDCYFYLLKNMV